MPGFITLAPVLFSKISVFRGRAGRHMVGLLIALSALLSFSAAALTIGAARPELYLPALKDKKVALVVNQTSVIGDIHLVDYLLSENVSVTKVMAPEHGFRGDAGAGETIADGVDTRTGLPVLSLYGKTKKPSAGMLADSDVIIFDIQDVGARFYTYISTLHLVLEAAAEQHKQVIVLDRPNPNGMFTDGPVREEAFASFVGMDPIPLLHGLTVGELALMMQGEHWFNQADALQLIVVPVASYNKSMGYDLPVAPSPNLPNAQSVQLYPSLCLFEATTVSVGRGTPFPFQVIGHDKVKLGSFSFTPVSMPNSAPSPKLQDVKLYGQDLRDTTVKGFDLGHLLNAFRQFKQAGEPFIDRPDFFDKLSGTDALRKAIEAGQSEEQIRDGWQPALDQFRQQRRAYLLYPES